MTAMDRLPDLDYQWFTYANVPDFRKTTLSLYFRYVFMILILISSIVLLMAETFVGVVLLIHNEWARNLFQWGLWGGGGSTGDVTRPSTTQEAFQRIGESAGWMVVGSTGLTVCAVLWDWVQARAVVESDSIPQAFLNSTAFRLWSIRSYSHFCLLSKIHWGQTARQRMVLLVYFGLEGSLEVLVTLPRLAIFGCILAAIMNVPGRALNAEGFTWLRISGYGQLESWLLRVSVLVMVVSAVVRALHLLRLLIASIICLFGLYYLGGLRKSMNKDLDDRISTLLHSTCRRKPQGSGQSRPEGESKSVKERETTNPQRPLVGMVGQVHGTMSSEKGVVKVSSPTAVARASEEFHAIDLNSDHVAYQHTNHPSTPTFQLYSSPDAVPMVDLAPCARTGSLSANNTKNTRKPSDNPFLATPTSLHPKNLMPPAPSPPNLSITSQSLEPNSQGGSNHTGRLAALSFYDDLLKSISSERMMYATSLSNQPTNQHPDTTAMRRDSHNPSAASPSIALCSSVPLSYTTSSELDDCISSGPPVHPFDVCKPSWAASDRLPTMSETEAKELYIHPLDIMTMKGGLEINLTSRPSSQESLNKAFGDLEKISRSGSNQSQETIENWRIHVAPTSPTIPVIEEVPEEIPLSRTRSTRGAALEPRSMASSRGEHGFGYSVDERSQHTRNESREYRRMEAPSRTNIPIVLSSHLHEQQHNHHQQHQQAMFLEQDRLYFSTEDLHMPRPSYAYGQSRTQRQGSVNSSIGGYNYSTAASSPSLADSLSNPMYHQQSLALGARGLPPRKGSLPSSVSSSVLEDHQLARGQPQPMYPPASHLGYPTRTRARTPSHLSNMVNPAMPFEIPAKDSRRGNSSGQPTHSHNQPKQGRFRSQSHGARTSSQQSSSLWSQIGSFKEAQAGYTTMIDLPPTTVSHIGYENGIRELNHTIQRSASTHSSKKTAMSLKEVLMLDRQATSSHSFNATQYQPRRHYEDDSDHLVHPLDMSPLLLQQSQPSQFHSQSHAYEHNSGSAQSRSVAQRPEVQTAWDEHCVGLGLTFSPTSWSGAEDRIRRPIDSTPTSTHNDQNPHRQPSMSRSTGNSSGYSHDYPHKQQQQKQQYQQPSFSQQDRPNMISRNPSEMTTRTYNSSSNYTTHPTQHIHHHATPSDITLTNPSSMSSTRSSHLDDEKDVGGKGYDSYTHHQSQQQYQQLQQLQQNLSQQQQAPPQQQRPPVRVPSIHQHFNALHRQPSQRNKKNLVVSIIPAQV